MTNGCLLAVLAVASDVLIGSPRTGRFFSSPSKLSMAKAPAST